MLVPVLRKGTWLPVFRWSRHCCFAWTNTCRTIPRRNAASKQTNKTPRGSKLKVRIGLDRRVQNDDNLLVKKIWRTGNLQVLWCYPLYYIKFCEQWSGATRGRSEAIIIEEPWPRGSRKSGQKALSPFHSGSSLQDKVFRVGRCKSYTLTDSGDRWTACEKCQMRFPTCYRTQYGTRWRSCGGLTWELWRSDGFEGRRRTWHLESWWSIYQMPLSHDELSEHRNQSCQW